MSWDFILSSPPGGELVGKLLSLFCLSDRDQPHAEPKRRDE
jgi:hypothetical protein